MALGGVATPTAVGILQKHLREDEEARVRQLCAESLAQAGAVEADAVKMAEQALIRALVGNGSGSPDDNSGVRIAAAYSLGLLPGTENGEARRQALTTAAEEDPHYWVRAAAEESLD
jgi:HEAT repeat protein